MSKEEEEDVDNIVFICPDCVKDQINEFQANLPQIKVGDFVKHVFVDHNKKARESMWVEITNIFEDSMVGILSNIPALVRHVYYKQEVEIKLSDCWSHIKA